MNLDPTLEQFIDTHPQLPQSQMRRLIRAGQNGDLTARNRLIEHNMRLITMVAHEFDWSDLPFEDRVQEGVFGIIRAVEKFDLKRPVTFSTYAVYCIRRFVQRAVYNTGRTIRLSVNFYEELGKIQKAIRELGPDASVEEIAVATKLTGKRILEIKADQQGKAAKMTSLSQPIGGAEDFTLGDSIPDKTPPVLDTMIEEEEKVAIKKRVRGCLHILTPFEVAIIEGHYGIDRDPVEIKVVAEELGRRVEAVSKAHVRALSLIGDYLSGTLSEEEAMERKKRSEAVAKEIPIPKATKPKRIVYPAVDGTKFCPRCKEMLPLKKFGQSNGRYRSPCKKCTREHR